MLFLIVEVLILSHISSRSHATFVQPETKPSQDSHIGDNLELENNKDGIINPAYEDEGKISF